MSALRIVLALATGALSLAATIAPAQAPPADQFNPDANDWVYSVAVQGDGKILVGGYFTSLGGQTRNYLGRLNPDGTLDTGFNPGADSYVFSLFVQTDGKILVGGVFTTLGGQTRNGIGRLNPDGTLDAVFNPAAIGGSVDSLAVQADGKILVGGQFSTLCGQPRYRIGRLNPNGTLDTAFDAKANSSVTSLALQPDGKILVGGAFTALGEGDTRRYLGRLNPDGTLDASFNTAANDYVESLAMQRDGKILVGGRFSTLGGQTRNHLGRLEATDPAKQNLYFDGSAIIWLGSGTSPEMWRTTFDWSPDGSRWTPLGEGTRIPGGWQRTNAVVPLDARIRARGFISGGRYNGSSGFMEEYWGLLDFIAQPQSRTNDAGTIAAIGAVAAGTPPLSYQWYKEGAALADDKSHIAGATTVSLMLTNVLGADAGGYWLVVKNDYGAQTSVVATLTVNDPAIAVPPVSKNVELGENATFGVTAHGTAPLSYQWWKDGVALLGQTAATLALPNPRPIDAGSYWVVVTSPYGSVTSPPALLTVNQGIVDTGFNPEADGGVFSLAFHENGKILVGGAFSNLAGEPRNGLGRLNPDGTLDAAFNPAADDAVFSLTVQPNGKTLVGGQFTTLAGQACNYLGRLNPDGTLDTAFSPGVDGGSVESLVVQADEKILAAGQFTTLGGQACNYLGRLNKDGTLDTAFNAVADDAVFCLAPQADGKILAGGQFTTLGGQTRNCIGRLNPDGTLDSLFNAGANNAVVCLAVQADHKILVGGYFTTLGGQTRNYLGRLNPDGTLDTAFNPGADGSVCSLAVQADGKILVSGYFTTLAGQMRNHLGRLNPDGTPDTGFSPGADYAVFSLAVQSDGRILVGGDFTTLGGQNRNHLGRLEATDLATQNLSFDGSALTWLRGGSSPEVWRTSFDWSPDGSGLWTPLGDGARISGGWQLTNAVVPPGASIRARGFVTGGENNSSSWFIETLITNRWLGPQFSGAWLLSDGNIQLSGSGPFGAPYRVLAATDVDQPLDSWVQIGSGTFTAGVLDFTDLQATNYPRRFYRIITP